jgi:hypothetical protein
VFVGKNSLKRAAYQTTRACKNTMVQACIAKKYKPDIPPSRITRDERWRVCAQEYQVLNALRRTPSFCLMSSAVQRLNRLNTRRTAKQKNKQRAYLVADVATVAFEPDGRSQVNLNKATRVSNTRLEASLQ